MNTLIGIIKAVLFSIIFFIALLGIVQLLGFPAVQTFFGIVEFFIENPLIFQIIVVFLVGAFVVAFFNSGMNDFNQTFNRKR